MNEYLKQFRGTAGIYAIVNMINGKKYIGSTIDLHRRKREHFAYLRQGVNGRHHSLPLKRAVEKYGLESFVFVVLDYNVPIDELIEREQVFIDAFGAEYNMTTTAFQKPNITPEVRKKMSESQRGKKHSMETRRKMSEIAKQRPYPSEETRKKLSESSKRNARKKGWKMSEVGKRNVRESMKYRNHYRGGAPGLAIIITDDKGEHRFPSIGAASRYLGMSNTAVRNRAKGRIPDNPRKGVDIIVRFVE